MTTTQTPAVPARPGAAGRTPRRSGRYQTKATGWTYTPARQRNIRTAQAMYAEQAAGRREDYTWLREEQGLTIAQAAERLGITFRQAQRYEAARKAAGQ